MTSLQPILEKQFQGVPRVIATDLVRIKLTGVASANDTEVLGKIVDQLLGDGPIKTGVDH